MAPPHFRHLYQSCINLLKDEFSLSKNAENLDLSYKTDLDFRVIFGRGKWCLITE